MTFFMGGFWSVIVLIAGIVVSSILGGLVDHPFAVILSITCNMALFIAVLVYAVCLTKQRCNDISGENTLLLTILFLISGLSFVLLFIPGQPKKNIYGKVPPNGTHLT
jgi:uncharacterized membrane protein YhaH (DUF805 family)